MLKKGNELQIYILSKLPLVGRMVISCLSIVHLSLINADVFHHIFFMKSLNCIKSMRKKQHNTLILSSKGNGWLVNFFNKGNGW